MRVIGGNGMGRISVDFQVANYGDILKSLEGTLPKSQVRRQTVRGIVDPGAAMLMLPPTIVKQLGLPPGDKIKVRYADGRRGQRRKAEGAYVELLGRHDTFTAVVEPKRDTALIGAIVLEALDLLVDCKNQCVIPRDPKGPIYELE